MMSKVIVLGGTARGVEQAPDDLALCRRIATGDQHLFAGLIDRFTGLVTGCLQGQGVDPADIEDLAQQVFINVYKGLGGFRGEAKLSSWIYRIALNTARAYLKRRALRPRPHSVEEAQESGDQTVDPRPDTQRGLTHNRELGWAMARLPVPQRSALALYYFEELTYEEIAEALQMNLNTVRTQIRRGKSRLAQLLDPTVLD